MKKGKGIKISLIIIGILIVITSGVTAGAYLYTNKLFDKIEQVEIVKENIGISQEVSEKLEQYNGSITNIALFGVDAAYGETGRSDAIMIATVDTHNKKLKLTSIMRDSYVNIDGVGLDKINHAYAFGGPELAIKTLNENFNLNIQDFVTVNFTFLPKIIDIIGGIELDIDSQELQYINEYIDGMNSINNTNAENINTTGVQYVDGTQAIAYCRIRYTDGGDYKRTERHREVLSKLLDKVSDISVTKLPELLNEILPMTETSLEKSKILELGVDSLKIGTNNLEQARFPLDGYCESNIIDEIYYLDFDKQSTVNQIYDYLFEDKKSW